MIAHRLLSHADFDTLYECFLTAFSDYEVDMQMSREQFHQRLARDGVRLEMSGGAFDGERMIGFCINGAGEWQGKSTAYDAGTGVVPGYRGRGVAKELFAFLEVRLKDAGFDQYLLEVLTTNIPAATLYRKLGFQDTRRLAVFRSNRRISSANNVVIQRVQDPVWELYRSFWNSYPSWQNSCEAVDRVVGDRSIVEAQVDDQCIGYGVVFVPSANLMQLAVSPLHRRKGIGSAILAALEGSKTLKINNIDEDLPAALAFYDAKGYKQVLSQYEMMKTL
ncbi:MAG TPA: GNAT family N-acetyltransferase [Pyrinomonadaceae bacterium]|nr:GNAT family N-acetyltransferase [Pyrinomonadaceae bacterium]